MRPISMWGHLMSSTVSVAARTCQDSYGKPTYGTPVSYRAHIARKSKIVRGLGGQEINSHQQIHLMSNVSVEETAQVTLSTADAGSTEAYALHPTIKAVIRRFDQSGPHHTVLFL